MNARVNVAYCVVHILINKYALSNLNKDVNQSGIPDV